VASLIVTQLLNIVFVPAFAHAGLALSISVAAWLNAGLLLILLVRSGRYRPQTGWSRFIIQLAVGLIALAVALWWWVPQFDWVELRQAPFQRMGLVLGTVVAGMLTYGISLLLVGIRPAQFARRPSAA